MCLAIYKDNEQDRFPADFIVYFEFCLDCEDFLKLVLCINDVPVAIGAVSYRNRLGPANAWLAFGMVSPPYQGKGLGSALLLARLSLLPKPIYSVRLFMTNVGASQAFYARFGFRPYGTSPSGRPGLMLACNSALLGVPEWQACRERATTLGLSLPTIEIPRPHGPENVLSSTRRLATAEVTSGLQIAVLVQLFGLIVLLVVDRPYNWLGALFVLSGGFLYRRERQRQQMRTEAALRKRYGYSHTL